MDNLKYVILMPWSSIVPTLAWMWEALKCRRYLWSAFAGWSAVGGLFQRFSTLSQVAVRRAISGESLFTSLLKQPTPNHTALMRSLTYWFGLIRSGVPFVTQMIVPLLPASLFWSYDLHFDTALEISFRASVQLSLCFPASKCHSFPHGQKFSTKLFWKTWSCLYG